MTKHKPRFLIAKYVPDLERMEPRNVGVIVWSSLRTAARFLGEHTTRVQVPNFVPRQGRHAYKQWISFWRSLLRDESLKADSGKAIERSSPEFVDFLLSKSKPGFMLVNAGHLMQDINSEEVDVAADEFFQHLVMESNQLEERKAHVVALGESVRAALDMAGLTARPDFKRNVPLSCKFGGERKQFTFNYALGEPESPLAVFQQASILEDRSLGNVGFWFLGLKNAKKQIRRYAMVLYHGTEEIRDDSQKNRAILKIFANDIIDVSNTAEAAEKIRMIAN